MNFNYVEQNQNVKSKTKTKPAVKVLNLKAIFVICHVILFPVIMNNNEKTVDGYGVQSNKLSKTVMAGDC